MRFHPREDYMLVRPLKRELSKIIHVVSNQSDQGTIGAQGEIVSIGPDVAHVSVGDVVLYGGEGLGCIDYPGLEDCKIIQEGDAVGIVRDDKLIPMTDIVLCEACDEVSDAGIVLVTNRKPDRAKVHMIGPKVTEMVNGDEILFNPFSGQRISLDRKEYIAMRESDVMAVLEKQEVNLQ